MKELVASPDEIQSELNYSSEADSFFLNQIDVIKEKQPNKREDMAIHRKIRGKLLSIILRKKIKTKQHMPVVIKAIGQESPVSKSLLSIGCFK